MMNHWPLNSIWAVILTLPLLFAALLLFVQVVVEVGPRSLREHRVKYRPIQTRIADLMLIIRLALQRN
ncbi:MAG TPA: hypothetical protein VF593_09690 [Chthoniobacteraceae bacterium]|jgi:hypothetical protein